MEPVAEHCRYCGRWLATLRKDGTFDLAPKAYVSVGFQVFTEIAGTPVRTAGLRGMPVPGSAKCLRWRCRWKARRSDTG